MLAGTAEAFTPIPKEKPAKLKEEELINIIKYSHEVPPKLDLKVGDSALKKEMKDNAPPPDLSSKYDGYTGDGRQRGDLKVQPEIQYVEPPDPTVSDRDMEKEFKLKFNLGL